MQLLQFSVIKASVCVCVCVCVGGGGGGGGDTTIDHQIATHILVNSFYV